MKSLKFKLGMLVAVTAITGGLLAAPAFASAQPNGSFSNCRGVVLSSGAGGHFTIADYSQLTGIPVQELQRLLYAEICSG